ncbi:hypothetical protein WJX73_010713 [Symbiochloris irregularis]|uniref:Uncharacterized protein n=1 Tax=Symbiochloris irregularis TaxID=706552 RepID=A0AAW1NKJ6_9CHLO
MVSTAVFDASAAAILFAIAILGACGPLALARHGKKKAKEGGPQRSLAFILGNMLSAGVMVSAGFVHLLGQAIVELPVLVADFEDEATAFPEGSQASPSQNGLHEPSSKHSKGMELTAQHRRGGSVNSANSGGSHARLHEASSRGADLPVRGTETKGSSPRHRGDSSGDVEDDMGESLLPEPHNRESVDGPAVLGDADTMRLSSVEEARSEQHHHAKQDGQMEDHCWRGTGKAGDSSKPAVVSFTTAVLMAVALCFHSILEGAAMGAQDNVVDTMHIFIAIAAHKGLAAYALGSSLVDSQSEGHRFWTVIGSFAGATPLGILIGNLLASFGTGRAAASLSALASGTFLYVAFMEVIPRELRDADHQLWKLLMLMTGFGAMSVLAIWA